MTAEGETTPENRANVGTVGAWAQSDADSALTHTAFTTAHDLGWADGTYDELLAFVAGYRVAARLAALHPSPEPVRLREP